MFFKKKRYWVVSILIIVLIVLLYFSTTNRENTLAYDNVVGFVVNPINKFFSTISEKTAGFFDYFIDKKELLRENIRLESELLELEHKKANLESLELENERLRAMLNLKEKTPQFNLVGATVISKDNSNYYGTFLIDKGTDDGIKTNMPIIGSKGLIGYITETGNNWARIQTIIDGGSSAGCMVSRTKSTAVTQGNTLLLNQGLLSMIYVSKDMNIVEGDLIETSGLGQIYPPGIIIGRVKEISVDTISKSQYAVIQPVEEFDTIKEVFIITNFEKPSR